MPAKRLRIVVTADPELPVPPPLYGGIERIVDMLVSCLRRRGHDVHLFAHRNSHTSARLVPYRGERSGSWVDTVQNSLHVARYVSRLGDVDIVHSFSRLAYLLPLMPFAIPLIQSYQRRIAPRSIRLGVLLAGEHLTFTACSRYCAETASFAGGQWNVIYNGVPLAMYEFRHRVPADAPLVFLSRVESGKGPHTAIEVARRTGRRLIIAGNHAVRGVEWEFFTKQVLPRCDGDRIKYVGPVNDDQKNALLGSSAAMLFPVTIDEAFGIVIAEALACGTPVIAFGRGGVPEIIDHNVTGFISGTTEEMVKAVDRCQQIDRASCRRVVEERFSDGVITDQYERLYRSRVAWNGPSLKLQEL